MSETPCKLPPIHMCKCVIADPSRSNPEVVSFFVSRAVFLVCSNEGRLIANLFGDAGARSKQFGLSADLVRSLPSSVA